MARRKKQKQEITCVQAMPPRCPRCGCTDRTKKTCVKKREISGTTREGITYTMVQWNYCNCKECNSRYRFIEYLKPAYRTSDTAKAVSGG